MAVPLVRFINSITELLQPFDSRTTDFSVSKLAERLDLPPLLVELRHEASHKYLPSLPTLENGARQALAWLDVPYWNPQMETLQEQGLLEDKISNMENVFVAQHFEMHRHTVELPSKEDLLENVLKDSGNRTLVKMQGCLKGLPELFERNNALKSDGHSRIAAKQKVERGIWCECDNSEQWQKVPICLKTGQKKVPGVYMVHLKEGSCSQNLPEVG